MGKSDPLRFIYGQLYDVIEKVENLYRIVDETGEGYLYSLKDFEVI